MPFNPLPENSCPERQIADLPAALRRFALPSLGVDHCINQSLQVHARLFVDAGRGENPVPIVEHRLDPSLAKRRHLHAEVASLCRQGESAHPAALDVRRKLAPVADAGACPAFQHRLTR